MIGYCTNVHAGADLAQTQQNLLQHSVAVRDRLGKKAPLPVGLWLSAQTARELLMKDALAAFREWLFSQQLLPFTLNGFPYGDFHQQRVKYHVYEPTWDHADRRAYTLNLIRILDSLLPAGQEGSISTLPVAWGRPRPSDEMLATAGKSLITVARHLARLEADSGRLIYLCLEPEPGCVLQRCRDVVEFFQRFLWPQAGPYDLCRYLRICHDVCHAAVMYEDQATVLSTYDQSGVQVGKVQISSAIQVNFDRLSYAAREDAVGQLAGFAEDRYLHQTVMRDLHGGEVFWDDLPQALSHYRRSGSSGEWRIHFHVPIDVDGWGHVSTTQHHIHQCLNLLAARPDVTHFEIETYAWDVLPPHLRLADLAEGIARELTWLQDTLDRVNGNDEAN